MLIQPREEVLFSATVEVDREEERMRRDEGTVDIWIILHLKIALFFSSIEKPIFGDTSRFSGQI